MSYKLTAWNKKGTAIIILYTYDWQFIRDQIRRLTEWQLQDNNIYKITIEIENPD